MKPLTYAGQRFTVREAVFITNPRMCEPQDLDLWKIDPARYYRKRAQQYRDLGLHTEAEQLDLIAWNYEHAETETQQ